MQTLAGSGVQLHSCLTLALDKKWSFSRPSLFTPPQRATAPIEWEDAGSAADIDFRRRDKCLAAARTRIPNHPAHSLVANPPTPVGPAGISCIMHSTRYIHLTLPVSISHTMSGVERKSQRSLLCRSLQLPFTSSALSPDVLHSTQFSNTQLMFLHLTASEEAFGARAPESK